MPTPSVSRWIGGFAPGPPRPKGSWIPIRTDDGGVALKNSSKGVAQWQSTIAIVIRGEMNRHQLPGVCVGPVRLILKFALPPLDASPTQPEATTTPDLDKLVRAVLDALKGVAYDDDKRVTRIEASKHYAATHAEVGAWITIGISGEMVSLASRDTERAIARLRKTGGRRARGRRHW